MDTKQLYESPATEVMELSTQGIVCTSPVRSLTLPGYGDSEELDED